MLFLLAIHGWNVSPSNASRWCWRYFFAYVRYVLLYRMHAACMYTTEGVVGKGAGEMITCRVSCERVASHICTASASHSSLRTHPVGDLS
jgi:hypothetical protein